MASALVLKHAINSIVKPTEEVLSRNKSLENSTIVVVTGLSQEEIGKRYLFKEGITIIEKPIPFERLKNIVLGKSKNRILKKS